MIKDSTIQQIRDRMDVADVLGTFLQLKRKGANLGSPCPFHSEKTASFTVSPAKQLYKCFGCGKSGDAITFLVEHERKTYPEALQWLADRYNITVEHEHEDEDAKKQRKEKADTITQMAQVVAFAYEKYCQLLMDQPDEAAPWVYLYSRGYTRQAAIEDGLGFAPDQYRYITPSLISNGWYNFARQLGLTGTTNETHYDIYRNRIIVPIHDTSGKLIALAGRLIPTQATGNEPRATSGEQNTGSSEPTASSSQPPKYLNPPDSLLYQKSKVLYGLYQAVTAKAFAAKDGKTPPAWLLEGYFDVNSFRRAGVHGAIAGCGTAITIDQLKLLRRYTRNIVLALDGDKAGVKKMLGENGRAGLINQCLDLDFFVEVIEFPNGHDPDDYARMWEPPVEYTKEEEDAIWNHATAP